METSKFSNNKNSDSHQKHKVFEKSLLVKFLGENPVFKIVDFLIDNKGIDLTKKDIIAINKKFSTGDFENESSLNFSLEHSKHSIAWTKQLAYLIRSILIDHVFVDGNKRSAYTLLLVFIELNDWNIKEDRAVEIIKTLVLKKEKSIGNIQRRIENAITK